MSYDFFIILFSYICGSIPFGLLISYFFKTNDPRNIGSKNIGATNVLRTGGLKLGLMTLILDILKGFMAIKITLILNSDLIGLSIIFVVIGHIFPIWLKFKGGKGVATFIGVLLGYNFQLFVLFCFTWLACALIFKYSSLAAIIALVINMLSTIVIDSNYVYFVIISFLILIKHSSNIQRLLAGKETKIILKKKIKF
ncbi:MAG: acyl-phosphate glycerol 3-phosphate acyltransferase [Rickettsiales bacterium]|nr:acyl-phosphate glycerol 3-phosphate acyltransferase [Rickettsiales bacterium]RPG14463.1 MAG: glycerol-3-phosphate 1-O-acyltransferase [Pelagibacteraceae bacterium TMED195]|tara:strand:+ start:1879 stop:2469 length:591 start_codon:yes stop_codon:yes gene_type:complete